MNTELQSTEWVPLKVRRLYIKNPRRSLSATFRRLRRHPRLSLIGDYPILAAIISTASEMGIKISRAKTLYAFNHSSELRQFSPLDKKELLDQLLNYAHVQTGEDIYAQ